jgi:hypothetical protein
MKFEGRTFPALLYADDACLIARGDEEAQRMLDELERYLQWGGFEINIGKEKTASMRFEAGLPSLASTLLIRGAKIPACDCYKYLGYIIAQNLDLGSSLPQLSRKTRGDNTMGSPPLYANLSLDQLGNSNADLHIPQCRPCGFLA